MAWSVNEKKSETKRTPPNRVVELRESAKRVGGDAGGEEKARDELVKERNLGGGMEMLEMEFLLGVIENTNGDEKNDVMMRKLSFNEVLRREQQNTIDSHSLSVYAVNQGNLYGKDIQCEAMKELTKRTSDKGKDAG
ncbi:MAG: hypothetical protein ACYSUC_00305 [Planctomycetota bacterium]|jgi:hypothetical protein